MPIYHALDKVHTKEVYDDFVELVAKQF